MKKTTQQKPPNSSPINPGDKEQWDFGYTGQKFFRTTKWAVYRCSSSPWVYFPFGMENMVRKGLIEGSQVVRFMEMLESENKEMELLAISTLRQLQEKMLEVKLIGKK